MKFIITLLFLLTAEISFILPQEKITIFSKGKHDNKIEKIEFSHDGSYLGIATNYWIELRDAQTLQQIKILENHAILIKSICFSPDSRMIAVGYSDGSIKIWDIGSEREIKTLKGHSNVVTSLVFSPNGKYLASGDWGGQIYLWDITLGKKTESFVKHLTLIRSLDFSPSGNLLVSGCVDNSVIVWDAREGDIIDIISNHISAVSCVKFNKQGDKIYSSGWDKTVRLWNVRERVSEVFARFDDYVNSISLSPDENKLACGLLGGTIKVLDVDTKRIENTITVYDKTLLAVVFSPNGKLISCGDTDKIAVHKLDQKLSQVPEVGSDIWLDIDLGDVGELFDMLKIPDTNTTYIATEKKGLIKSDDGKTNWQRADKGIDDVVISLAMDKEKVLYVGTKSKGIFESRDEGISWNENNDGLFEISKGVYPEIFDIAVQPKTNKKYIATGKGIFKKEKKWDSVSEQVVRKLCFSPKDHKKLYAGSKKGGLFLSRDAGKNWDLILKEREDEKQPVRAIAVDPETSSVFVARGDEGILVSDDDRIFREKNYGLPVPVKVHAIKIGSKNTSNLFIASDKGVFISKNKGNSWKENNDGFDVKKFEPKLIAFNKNEQVAVAGSGGLFEIGKVQDKKVISSINFEIDSSRILLEAFPVLNEIANKIEYGKDYYVIVHGHTDNTGSDEHNLELSLNRAESVKSYFVSKGIENKRIRTAGFGKTKPIMSNETEEGRAKNRRVEILLAGFEIADYH